MQFKQTLVRLLLLLLPCFSFAQTTYLPQGDKANILIERLEIKAGKDTILNFSKTKPFSRQHLINGVNSYVQKYGNSSLSKTDAYDLRSIYINNLEYMSPTDRAIYKSKKPIAKNFYTTPGTLYEAHIKDFDLAINPVLQFQLSKENNNNEKLFLNTRGVRVRGRIASKIGFDAYITDNQERDPLYVQQNVTERKAV